MGSRPRTGRRTILSIEELPLVGGALCLDLVNTTGARASGTPRERLHAYDDLVTWGVRTGALGSRQAAALRRAAGRRPRAAEAALHRALGAREALYRLLAAVAAGSAPPPDAVEEVSEWWRQERDLRRLRHHAGTFSLELALPDDDLDRLRWLAIASAVDLLASDDITDLRRCGECDWLFLDRTKNRSRTWCKKACGDRVRARRHYRRHRPGSR